MFKQILIVPSILAALLFIETTYAQTKVVVIPMSGDDVAMAQQNFRYNQAKNTTSGTEAFMCESDVYNTPNQVTQAMLVANANAHFARASAFWDLKIQVSKNSGSYLNISPFTSYTGAKSDARSQISTTDILDLDPNSTYQFRLRLKASAGATFSPSFLEYCELLVSATYKLPAEKNIWEIAP